MTFEQDIIDLLSYERGGHVQHHLYTDEERPGAKKGSHLWRDFLKAHQGTYYPLLNDIRLIQAFARTAQFERYDALIDFGPGDCKAVKNKAIPVLTAAQIKHYVPIDCVTDYTDGAEDKMGLRDEDIEVTAINANFYEDPLDVPEGHNLGIFFGSTISNQPMKEGEDLPIELIAARLRHMTQALHEGTLLISYDSNNDGEDVKRAYNHPHWKSLVTGIMHDVERKLKPTGNFNPHRWKHEFSWNARSHTMHQCIAPEIDQRFSIGEHDFNIERGQRFVVKNNIKYPAELFRDICAQVDIPVEKTQYGQDRKIVLQKLAVQEAFAFPTTTSANTLEYAVNTFQ